MDLHRRRPYQPLRDDQIDAPFYDVQQPDPPNHVPDLDDFFNDAFPMDDGVIDLTADRAPVEDPNAPQRHVEPQVRATQTLTEEECRQQILDVFPDIEHDHVMNMIREQSDGVEGTHDWCARLIERILDGGTYPKERDKRNSLKRKRSDDDDDALIEQFEKNDHFNEDTAYFNLAKDLLRDEFLYHRISHIEATLRTRNTLFKTFDTLHTHPPTITRPRKPTNPAQKNSLSKLPHYDELQRELQASKKNREKKRAKREKEDREKLVEETNLLTAQQNNEMSECQVCFDEVPTNRMTFCNGPVAHLFCLDCAKKHVSSQMEMMKCRPVCPATIDCKAPFSRSELKRFLGETAFERLEKLQQLEDIQAAGLDDLDECPFCDFKAECPPIEIDKEFRCQNESCGKTSCRLCKLETHIPLTCEEFKKDNKVNVRHAVEEAMSQALIRNCNQCKKPFVKDYGCNKMVCPSCGNKQCYVCSQSVRDYEHFSDDPHNRKCPLHDNTLERHDQEVKKAEEEALKKLRAEHPELAEEDLKVKVSEAVKKEEEARIRTGRMPHAHGYAQIPMMHRPFDPYVYGHRIVFPPPPEFQFGLHVPPGQPPAVAPPRQPYLNPYPPPAPGQMPPGVPPPPMGNAFLGRPRPGFEPFGGAPVVQRVPHFLQQDGELIDAAQLEAARRQLEQTQLEIWRDRERRRNLFRERLSPAERERMERRYGRYGAF